MLFWLRFRCVQVYRLLKATGWSMLLLMLFATAGIWLGALQSLSRLEPLQVGTVAFLSVGLLHVKRSDRMFLQQTLRDLPSLLLVDYALILAPFALFFCVFGQFWNVLALFPTLVWSILPLRSALSERQTFILPLSFVPPAAYEWLCIFRSSGLLVLLGMIVQLGSCYHFALFLMGSALVLLALPTGFDHVGPYSMFPNSRKAFLLRWRALAKIMHICLLPGYLLLVIFQSEWWFLALYIFISAETFLLLCFTYKINAWEPERIRVYNANITSLTFLFLLLPGLIIIPMAQALWFFNKTNQRLELP